jgi:hypothetical protein
VADRRGRGGADRRRKGCGENEAGRVGTQASTTAVLPAMYSTAGHRNPIAELGKTRYKFLKPSLHIGFDP